MLTWYFSGRPSSCGVASSSNASKSWHGLEPSLSLTHSIRSRTADSELLSSTGWMAMSGMPMAEDSHTRSDGLSCRDEDTPFGEGARAELVKLSPCTTWSTRVTAFALLPREPNYRAGPPLARVRG